MVQQSKKAKWKIKKGHYYFIDLRKPLEPRVLRDSYFHRLEAKSCFEKYLKDSKRYFLITGEELMEYKGQFTSIKPPYSTTHLKIDRRRVPVFSSASNTRLSKINIRLALKEKLKYLGISRPKMTYDYPDDCITTRQKKTFREWKRRKFLKQFKHVY